MAEKLPINPTRQELLVLKRKFKTAKRGHKLLKEKRDGLMKSFMGIVRDAKTRRRAVEEALNAGFRDFLLVAADMHPKIMQEALMAPEQQITLNQKTKNVMGVKIPEFSYEEVGHFLAYSLATTNSNLDTAIAQFSQILRQMVELAQIEQQARLLAAEIEKTRRRVNALEYVFIPRMGETIKYISQKLGERERETIVSIMHIKKTVLAG